MTRYDPDFMIVASYLSLSESAHYLELRRESNRNAIIVAKTPKMERSDRRLHEAHRMTDTPPRHAHPATDRTPIGLSTRSRHRTPTRSTRRNGLG